MPLAAPAEPARSVLDGGEHGAILARSDEQKRPFDLQLTLTTGRRSYELSLLRRPVAPGSDSDAEHL